MDELLNKMEFFLSEKVKDIKKLWIYQNRIIVLDIEINNNRIAFYITPDINAKNVKVELFCRNTSEYLSDFEKEAISFSKNRYLIFQDSIKEIELMVININNYINKIKLLGIKSLDILSDEKLVNQELSQTK